MVTEVYIQTDPLAGVTMRYHHLLLTGTGGNLGKALCKHLPKYTDSLCLPDISDLGEVRTGEGIIPRNLIGVKTADVPATGADAIVHLGGVSVKRPFGEILPVNIVGTYSLYETARRHGIRRIVFANSNHTIGFYKQGRVIDDAVPTKSDDYCGLSRALDGQLASFYSDHYGIKTIIIHIGSSFIGVKDRHVLVTQPGCGDLEQLIRRALFVPNMSFTTVCDILNNHGR